MIAIFIQIYRLIDWHKLREIEIKSDGLRIISLDPNDVVLRGSTRPLVCVLWLMGRV